LEFQRVLRHFPVQWWTWLECASLVETIWLIGLAMALLVWRQAPQFDPARRKLLQAAGVGLCIAPLAATAFGVVRRNRFRVSEVSVPVRNLPRDLDGLRIVQITDIHLSPFLSEREFAYAIDMANETRANIALVTGDLITRPGDPLDACLGQLARLRADAGVLGCLGNHEIVTRTENYVTEQGRRIGIDFLRHQSRQLRFGKAVINFAGVDYQKMHSHYLQDTERLIVPGAVNIMLSHNPDVFPVAAAQGYDLTIAGHTHGGQVDVEILHQHVNVARYFTPFVQGLYRRENSSVYVSNGLGTIGVPVRLGAPPEVSVLRLCAI
jgi:predicted MPP superfamily phosphohydrolase